MADLWQHAKDAVLKEGEHVPMIYAEARGGELFLIAVVGDAETTTEKRRFLFSAGRKVGMENKGKELTFLCFVNEAWTSEAKSMKDYKYSGPSKDPNRREALVAQVMDLTEKPVRQMVYIAEMLRDGTGELVDLLPRDKPMEVQWTLLPPFLNGWLSARYSDEQLVEMTLREIANRGNKEKRR